MKDDTLLIGRKPVTDALDQATKLEKIWIDKDMRGELEKLIRKLSRENKIPLQYVPKQKLSSLCGNANHQGLIAQLAIVDYYTVEELVPLLYEHGKSPFLLVLDGIEDVRNLGALARSAVWFDCDGIVLPAKKAAPINSFAYKASSGAIKDIPICREASLQKAIQYLKSSGVKILIADTENNDANSLNYSEPIALVLGSEGTGVAREIKNEGDATISIPGSGKVESLNVSVAGAILMHQIFIHRQTNINV